MSSIAPARSRIHSTSRKLWAALLVVVLAIAGVVVFTNESKAAGPGTGWGTWGDNIYGYHGSFDVGNGTDVYCLQPTVPLPTGTTTNVGYRGNVAGLSGNTLAGINAVITKYGQTSSRDQAAAVSMAVKAAADYNATVYDYNYDGRYGANLSGAVIWQFSRYQASGANLGNIDSMVNAYYNEIRNTTAAATGGSGTITFQVDHLNNYYGTITVSLNPTNATGTVTLTNGVFRDTGSATRTNVRHGQVIPIVGVPPQSSPSSYKISANGNFTAPGSGYSATVRVYTTPGGQTSGGPGQPVTRSFSVSATDPVVRSGQFIPNLSTAAPAFRQEGQAFTDAVTFFTVADDEGTNNSWPTTTQGNYFPIVAQGTLYGPFASRPAVSATPPAGAPVAATATVTTTGARGADTYNVSAGIARDSGYYTWVWEIHQDRQSAIVQNYIPDGYVFADQFGLTAETSIVPMKPVATSAVTTAWADPGGQVRDTLTVSNSNGLWLTSTSVRFDGTAYGLPHGTVPSVQSGVPSNARVLGTQSLSFSSAGTKTSTAVTVPDDIGSVVWVWRFDGASQAQPNRFASGYTWADQFGLAAETTRIRMSPVLTTQVVDRLPGAEGTFEDQVTLSIASGRYIAGTELTAYGTLYGPLANRPTAVNEVPEGAPVAHETSLTFTGEGTQTTNTGFTSSLAGHYTWVWRIDSAEQTPAAQTTLPAGYRFQDQFGLDAETSIQAMQLGAESAVTKPEIILGEESVDTLRVWQENGEWLQQDGVNLPVRFRGTSYFVPGDTHPEQAPTAPEDAEVAEVVYMDISEPGDYTMPAAAGEEHRKGFRTWVWEVLDEDQLEPLRGMVAPWADEFGMPTETQDVLMPSVRTMAQAGTTRGGTIQDTAYVTGPLPVRGAELTFEAYAIPMVRDAKGKWVIDYPEAPVEETPAEDPDTEETPVGEVEGEPTPTPTPTEEPEEPAEDWSWVVAPENLIGSNLDGGQIITEPGEYVSPKYTVPGYAKVLWVESLWTVAPTPEEPAEPTDPTDPTDPPVDGEEPPAFERKLIHRGVVGIPEETSFVLDVKTYAMSDTGQTTEVEHGVETWDTAHLTGYVPEGGKLTFEAYIVPVRDDVVVAESCTPERLAWTSPSLELEGGLYSPDAPLKLTSASHVFDPDFDSALYWVAVVTDELDREVSRGECGDPDETLGLKGQKLIQTGGPLFLGGSLALVLIAASAVFFTIAARRRRIAG